MGEKTPKAPFVCSVSWAMLATMLVAAGAFAQTELPEWEPITQERLMNPEDGDWLSYRRTPDVFGFSPLDQINRTNVHDLRPVWSYSMQDNSRWVPTPIVANGLMYVAEGSGRVVAFDVVSGDVAWIHERDYPEDIRSSQAFGRHRGVSVYQDKIYWGTADSYLVALDARTGSQIWEVRTGDYHTGLGHNHPPLIADDKIILGFTGGDRNARGAIAAYDPQNGALIWKTYTVPAPGEPGSESWNDSNLPPLGGLTWGTQSYDPELGFVYFGTGQPTPWSSTLRGLVMHCTRTRSSRSTSRTARCSGTFRSFRKTIGTWTRRTRAPCWIWSSMARSVRSSSIPARSVGVSCWTGRRASSFTHSGLPTTTSSWVGRKKVARYSTLIRSPRRRMSTPTRSSRCAHTITGREI